MGLLWSSRVVITTIVITSEGRISLSYPVLKPHSEKLHPHGRSEAAKRALPAHAQFELRNSLSAFSLDSWALTRADSQYQVVCGWQRLASHSNRETASVSWVNRKLRLNLCSARLSRPLAERIKRYFWVRRECLSRQERDEDDTTVMASCVSVAICSCSLLVSWLNVPHLNYVLLLLCHWQTLTIKTNKMPDKRYSRFS